MQYFLLGLLALALTIMAIRLFNQANPAALARHMRIAGAVTAFAGALFFMVRGGLAYAFPLAALGWWLLNGQGIGNWGNLGAPRGSTSGQTSRVVTEHLEMELDHTSGSMRGRVLKGFFAGRDIEDLKPVELAHLWQDCRYTDPASAQLVEAFLDRIHPSWREDMARSEQAPRGPDGRMTVEEALEILGLQPGADEAAIRQAHRDLMLKLHPDRGGSTYLAAKINEAKDTLLGGS